MTCELHHQPPNLHSSVESRYSHHLKPKAPKRPLHVEEATHADNPWGLSKDSFGIQKFKQRSALSSISLCNVIRQNIGPTTSLQTPKRSRQASSADECLRKTQRLFASNLWPCQARTVGVKSSLRGFYMQRACINVRV